MSDPFICAHKAERLCLQLNIIINQLAISFTSVPYVPQSSDYNKIPNLRGESLFKKFTTLKMLLEMGKWRKKVFL